MSKLANPFPLFLDGRGALLDGGYIYVGATNVDPEIEANQFATFWDAALTLPAPQPLRTLGGLITNNGNPSFVYLSQTDYAMTVRDANLVLVWSVPSFESVGVAVAYQPEDADLTAIAALTTTAYGRNLLTLANTAALKSATGIPDCLPLIGGNMTGGIIRQGAGIHPYWFAPGMTGGRRFLTAAGVADPTSLPGDEWLTY